MDVNDTLHGIVDFGSEICSKTIILLVVKTLFQLSVQFLSQPDFSELDAKFCKPENVNLSQKGKAFNKSSGLIFRVYPSSPEKPYNLNI